MTTLKFTKMHGLGNDFMVIDAINQTIIPENLPISTWSNRHTGIGFDQLLIVEPTQQIGVDFRYRIFNADGNEVEQCGNGARCFARFVVDKHLSTKKAIIVETKGGVITPKLNDDYSVTVNMGQPRLAASDIPMTLRSGESEEQIDYVIINGLDSATMTVVNMGNPHAVMLVEDIQTAPVEHWGSALQNHPRFPQQVNVGFMQIINNKHIKLRVYERGAGETQACGTGACAAVVAGIRLGLLVAGEPVLVSLPGGDLQISWKSGSDVLMTGPAITVFEGEIQF